MDPNQAGGMGYYNPSYGYGGGGTTQNMIGLGAGLLGNLAFPGLGGLTGPLGKFITQLVQQSGGMQDAMNPGGQSGFGGVPSPASGGLFARGPAIHYSQGGLPSPGGWGGVYGQGSAGNVNMGGYDYFGQQSLKNLLSGGDTSLGFQGLPNANATAGAPTLPISQWGGAMNNAVYDLVGSGKAVNPDFKEISAK